MINIQNIIICVMTVTLAACSSFSHTNIKQEQDEPVQSRATFDVTTERGHDDALVILALSGGGSRAAYWSASIMLRLQTVFESAGVDILSEVDAISSVSGGSLPAAYYVISTEPGEPPLYGRVWDEKTVKKLMSKNYTRRWFGNWFWPTNIVKFWFTAYDRTDIMAQTLSDNLYDKRPLGGDLKIRDLNPLRPYLVLNATNGTRGDGSFGTPFTFTEQEFSRIGSDVNDYDLARAVMGTATFPAVFNYMTVRNFRDSPDKPYKYTHLFDGGNVDNLGLKGVGNILDAVKTNGTNYRKLVVILIDSYTSKRGVSSSAPDTRKFLDFIVDSNFIDATDSLLTASRDEVLNTFKSREEFRVGDGLPPQQAKQTVFCHIQFADVQEIGLRDALNNIPTNFSISAENTAYIDRAVDQLIVPENSCLVEIKNILTNRPNVMEPIFEHQN